MTDHDELLHWADDRATPDAWALDQQRRFPHEWCERIGELAAALRTALAARPQALSAEELAGLCDEDVQQMSPTEQRLLATIDLLQAEGEKMHDEALAVVVGIAFDWAGEYGLGSPAAARRVWEAARLLRPDLEPKAPATPTHRDEAGNEWITPAEDMWQDDDEVTPAAPTGDDT